MDGGTPVHTELSLNEIEAQITELAGQLNAAQYRWLMLIAEFDRRSGWAGAGVASCAHWLNFKCGLNLGAARERVRVAHALEGLPHIAASMSRGELSYSKVRALTRVACPATEDNLLNIALHGTAYHVETLVRLYRRAKQAEELSREQRQHASRHVSYHFDDDGSLIIRASLPAIAGATLLKALEAAMDDVPSTETFVERRAEALALIAEAYLENAQERSGGTHCHQVVLHVDAESLEHHTAGRCHVENGPQLAVETARRISCDTSLTEILENDRGEPLDVGRKTRTIPPAIRRALRSRDAGCCFPGCTFRRHLDAHHIEHWADGGETKLDNLVSLCRWHHRLVHEGGISVERLPFGAWRFTRPDGSEFELPGAPPRPYDWAELEAKHKDLRIHIGPETSVTRWRGERMDYDLGVAVLCNQAERAPDVSAETSGAAAS
jgi:hypothetical protein